MSLAAGMWAQSPTSPVDHIPLKNWAAPLHWLPPSAQEAFRQKAVEASAPDAAGATQPLQLVAITPCRVMDTRAPSGFPGAFGPPSLQGNTPRTIPIPSSSCGIPSSAAYSLNFTLVSTYGPVGFVAAWPDNVPFPGTSITNAFTGGVVANAAVVPAGPDGGIDVMVSSIGDLVIDINGYYVPGGSGGGSNATTVNGASVPANATFTGTNSTSQFTALTAAQATTAIAAASGGGTTNFLRADGTWAVPASGGGGGGTITAVNHGTYLTGGGTSGSVTLDVDTTKVPTLGAATNTFTGSISAAGGVTAGAGLTGTPLAYGTFNSTGAKQAGSSNISCSWDSANSRYLCAITGQSYYYTEFVTNVTPFNAFAVPVTDSFSGNLIVKFYSQSGTQIQAVGFAVTVYKP